MMILPYLVLFLVGACSGFAGVHTGQLQRRRCVPKSANGEEDLGDLRLELLENPVVEVRASEIEGAGDGVFTKRDVSQGETLTWIDFVYESAADLSKGMNVYRDNYFKWHEEKAAYELADGSQRSPLEGGVGHIINDGACIHALRWNEHSLLSDGKGDCSQYLEASEAAQNVALVQIPGAEVIDFGQGQLRSRIQAVKAIKNISAGQELLRCYGQAYWLGPAEYELLYLMEFARVDLRLAAKILHNQANANATFFERRAQDIFTSASARLDSLAHDFSLTGVQEKWSQRHPHRAFDGYETWLWMHLPPAQLRTDLAARLHLYSKDTSILFDASDEALPPSADRALFQDILRELHTLDGQTFGNLVRTHLDPPFSPEHDARCQSGLQAGGRSFNAFGQDPSFPW